MMDNMLMRRTAVYGSGGILLAGLYEAIRSHPTTEVVPSSSRPPLALKRVKETPHLRRTSDLLTLLIEVEECIWKCDRISWIRLVNGLNDLVGIKILMESDPSQISLRDRIRAFTYMKRFTDSSKRIMCRLEVSTTEEVREVIRVQRIMDDISKHAQNNLSVIVFHTRDVLM